LPASPRNGRRALTVDGHTNEGFILEESTRLIWQGIVNGLTLGWIYVLMALGLTLIFGIMNIMQFAHGELYMLAAYLAYFLCKTMGINLVATIFICMGTMAGLGVLLERFLFRPVTRGHFLAPIAISLGLTLILQSGAMGVFGLFWRSMPRLSEGSLTILGGVIPKDRIVAVSASVALLLVLYVFLKKTKYGLAMTATAQDLDGATLQGISRNRMSALVMAIGCALAAAGGILAGSLFAINPTMGVMPLLKGLIIIVVGGVGSLAGAAIAGIMLGLMDGLVILFLGPMWASLLPLILVILFLLTKPEGLLGHE
jgi:branched-chain amino acid transport system permease protein